MPSFRASLSKSGGKWKLQKTHGSGRYWIIQANSTDELVNQLKDTIKREEIMSEKLENSTQIPIEDLKIDGTDEEFARIERALRGEDFDKAESYRRVFTQLSNGKAIDPVLVHEDGVLMDGFHRTMLYKYMQERTGNSKYDKIPAVIVPRDENVGVNDQTSSEDKKQEKEVDKMDKYDIYQAEVERIQNQESNGELDECIKKKVAEGMEREKAIEECRGKSKGNGNGNDND